MQPNPIQQWSNENDMVLNLNKSKILSISGETPTTEENQSLEISKNQKDLRVIMCSNLSWAENCRKRFNKGWRSFYALKRNISPFANLPTKLYAFIGYVVPVLTYASHVWYPSKLDRFSIEF